MKISILCNYPIQGFPEDLGVKDYSVKRITTWNENLIHGLSSLSGVELYVITTTREISKTKIIQRGNVTFHFLVFPRFANFLTSYRYAKWVIRRIIKKTRPDILHGIGTEHMWPMLTVGVSLPHVITIHGILSEFNKNEEVPWLNARRYFGKKEIEIISKPIDLITINEYVEKICSLYNANHRYYRVENPIARVFQDHIASPDKSSRLLFIGDFEPRKNLLFLLNNLNKINSANIDEVLVVGKIKDMEYYSACMRAIPESWIKKFRNIEFLLPGDIAKVMKESGALVLTSKNETAPMVIAEAMTVGIPVVATNVGGVQHMIRHNIDGIVIDLDDSASLVKHIDNLFANADLRVRMGREARKKAIRDYDPIVIARKTYDVYKEIIRLNNE